MKKLLLLIPLLIILAGCGAPSGAEETARQYTDKLLSQDWSGACAMIEGKSNLEAEKLYGRPCPEYIERLSGQWITLQREEVLLRKIFENSSRASFQTDVSEEPLTLVWDGERWQVVFFE